MPSPWPAPALLSAARRLAMATPNPPTSRSRSASLAKPAVWLYNESGIASVYDTGRDACLVILSRTCRMFAFGAIGLFMSLTLLGDVVLGLAITLMADGLGRRRVMFAGESMLSHITTPKTRANVLSWYITCSSLGSAVGTELTGRFVDVLKEREGWDILRAYHATFLIYIAMGGLNVVLALLMSKKCEIEPKEPERTETPDESAQGLLDESDLDDDENHATTTSRQNSISVQREPAQKPKARFSQISSSTRSAMYKLWFLLAVDSLADGMVNQTLTNYFLDRKFHLTKAALGHIMSVAMILATVSTVFAGPLCNYLGLLNTMVFTHIPSSAAVLFFPVPNGLVMTIILLYIRMGLNNMDQAPRAAFIAAIVKPDERTAVMGITSTIRTLAMTVGPLFTGALAGNERFWIAFVVGGALRLVYDVGLWAMFVNMKLHVHESNDQERENLGEGRTKRSWP
ncbi:unnamed protein product [Parascedosporium putredinis]|uniref:Major facilitator superfamily (MFS) profile domain-containing protein n=1 Tax=Parascedosporium putredinis TaxID=1442378 RepID=A0A9P1M8D2_9PEZI|nr:unnamed protein product [Parascedosporium putredinis]CAI7989659.1 unnamed protein product [Parascedosporium putredinis]